MGLRDLVERLSGSGKEALASPDGFVPAADDPYRAEHQRLAVFLHQLRRSTKKYWLITPADAEEGEAILALPREEQLRVLVAAVERLAAFRQRRPDEHNVLPSGLAALAGALLARQLPQTDETLTRLLDCVSESPSGRRNGILGYLPLGHLCRQVERHAEKQPLTADVAGAVKRLAAVMEQRLDDRESIRLRERLAKLLRSEPELKLAEEPWTLALVQDLRALPETEQRAWTELLVHCRDSAASKPAQKWLAQTGKLAESIGAESFQRHLSRWLELLPQMTRALPDLNASTLRGLFWTCSRFPEPDVCRLLGAGAEACFKKIPEWGARSPLAGNGALWALGALGTPEAISELARLRMRIKGRQPVSAVEKALEDAATRAGKSREELEELCVPSYGLDPDGVLRETLGDYTAEVSFTLSGGAEWRWVSAAGKAQKSIPEQVKRECPEDLAALKKAAGEVQKMLPAHRARVERLLRSEREWDYPNWRERYLDHPLMGLIAQRLIWHFRQGDRSGLAAWHRNALVDVEGRSLEWPGPETRVRLWHPVGFEPEAVLAWRTWLEEREVVQPFKQAHREVYLLTDAELATRTYSNRFAGHILRQHQLNQLCAAKGWTYRLQGQWDSGAAPMAALDLPEWGLRAEYWVDAAAGPASEMGVLLYVATDQVRFVDRDTQAPRPLSEVPAPVFTEVMRDVDLFVSVASIGADPAWQDRGEERYGGYWHSYSFGELSGSAANRKEILARLLPRLKIASRCSLDGRFLRVRGDLRTYKIHLGSGNILMEPNDQYLCIVPDRGAKPDNVFLPFEGDSTLAVILSKAFLLADDRRIKDPAIRSQIDR